MRCARRTQVRSRPRGGWVPESIPRRAPATDDPSVMSKTRETLRRFFEVDRHHVVVAALRALGLDREAAAAIERYEIDGRTPAPWSL